MAQSEKTAPRGHKPARHVPMDRSKLSLKWLEVFQAVARRGSIRDGAADLGISISTASHHLTCLENVVGTPLVLHSKRPMLLTAQGEMLLRRVDKAMWLLRTGVSETWSDDITLLQKLLRIALIEDFDADVGPDLVNHLAQTLPACDFAMMTRPTHEILELLQSERIDVGIAASAELNTADLVEEAILRDPYLVVLPRDERAPSDLADLEALSRRLPLLRYSKSQVIGRRIEAQLRRVGLRVPKRMEFESTQTLLSLVANNRGWGIMTALGFARATRFHDHLHVVPFPGTAFARQISVFRRDDLPVRLHALIVDHLRMSIQRDVIDPTVKAHPWLASQFHVLAPRPTASRSTRASE